MILQVELMDLGEDVRAVGLELLEEAEGDPVRGEDGAAVWSAALAALAGNESWTIDFFGDVESIHKFCETHSIPSRQVSRHLLVALSSAEDNLVPLFKSFGSKSFGVRAGSRIQPPDSELEGNIASSGLDAYQQAYSNYLFCGLCDFENGSLVLLSNTLWATEIVRRIRPKLSKMQVHAQIAS